MNIAVLGGGITGLTAAFHLGRRFPHAAITLLEKESRLGGWVRSERVFVETKNGPVEVLLEAGPRSLRPRGKSALELINLLDITHLLHTIPKSAPVARNRFLHVPPRKGLLPVPYNLYGFLTSPLSRTIIPAVCRDIFGKRRPLLAPEDDESVHDFLSHHFGSEFARIFGSSIVHGVYAGDSRLLSVRAAFPALAQAAERGDGGILRGILRARNDKDNSDGGYNLGDVRKHMDNTAVYTFRDGIGTITDALQRHFSPNIRIRTKCNVTSLRPTGLDFEISTSSGETLHSTHVVSALPLRVLYPILPPSSQLLHLTYSTANSVTVLSLIFKSDPTSARPLHPPGFGYLVPRLPGGYHGFCSGVLGVVFEEPPSPDLIHMTVMLGGPYKLNPANIDLDSVLRTLSYQLDVALPSPIFHRMVHHKDCIPNPQVSHISQMRDLRNFFEDYPWNGRMTVIGASVGGVSVSDCIEGGRTVGRNW